jgi:excisionase family DNA binding protein
LLQELNNRLRRIEGQLDVQANKPMNVEEASNYLSISKSSLYRLTSSGDIAHCKPNGKKVYFLRADLDTWVQRRRVKTNAELEREINSGAALRSRERKRSRERETAGQGQDDVA